MNNWIIGSISVLISSALIFLIMKIYYDKQLKKLKEGYNGTEDKSRRVGPIKAAKPIDAGNEEPRKRKLLSPTGLAEFGVIETGDSEDEPTEELKDN